MDILHAKKRALELIDRIKRQGAFSHVVLQAEAKRDRNAPGEYPIVVSLVRGVLQEEGRLDKVLNEHLPRGITSLPNRVADILRLGAFQIISLDRVQKKDVVFESVELLKGGRFSGFMGLVNAVLRKIEPKNSRKAENASQNFPTWLIDRWSDQFGSQEVEQFCAASTSKLPLYLRVHTGRCSRQQLCDQLRQDGIQSVMTEWSPNSVRVVSLPYDRRLEDCTAFQQGWFFIQDCSSTIIADAVAALRPQTVRDVCAAPGGKACSVALSLDERGGRIFASDRTSRRVELVRQKVQKLGLSNVDIGVMDMLAAEEADTKTANVVLVDAPCSGFGTVAKKIEARWNTSAEELCSLVEVQSAMLSRAAKLVAPAGALVYSTCSIDWAENEGVIKRFLVEHPEFSVKRVHEFVSERLCTAEGYLRTWPHRHEMTGAFAAILIRKI